MPFDSKFKTLGLEIDTGSFPEGHILIGHTDSRKEELHSQLKGFLEANTMTHKDAERMRGRMIFFEGYTFGRVANSSVKAIGRFCHGSERAATFDSSMRRSLQFLQQRVLTGRPLKIQQSMHNTWMVFTDGACDPEARSGSVGGVIYDPQGNCLRYFGESVPQRVMDALLATSQNPIHELEVMPILLAAELWGKTYEGSQVVYYIDNESARMAHIRGDGETLRAAQMIQAFVEIESTCQHRVWFGRVPSYSNPTDGPSRLNFLEVSKLGATRTSINWEMVMKHLEL